MNYPKIAPAVLAAFLMINTAPAASTPATDPAATVVSFCEAISSRKLDSVLTFLAPGSVQFGLRPAHTGMDAGQASLTTDLRGHWSTIGPVLFSATSSYSRKAEILDSHVDGDIATVWAAVSTESVRSGQTTARKDKFVEVYLLVRRDGAWKIGAVADNRRPNDIGASATQQ